MNQINRLQSQSAELTNPNHFSTKKRSIWGVNDVKVFVAKIVSMAV